MEKISIQELAAVLTVKNGLKKKEAEQVVAMIFDVVKDNLKSERLVKIKGLGTFKIVEIEARESINVNTGERVLIEGHEKVTFTPDTAMKDLVNKPFSQFETVILNDGVDFDKAAAVPLMAEDVEDESEDVVVEESVEMPVEEPEAAIEVETEAEPAADEDNVIPAAEEEMEVETAAVEVVETETETATSEVVEVETVTGEVVETTVDEEAEDMVEVPDGIEEVEEMPSEELVETTDEKTEEVTNEETEETLDIVPEEVADNEGVEEITEATDEETPVEETTEEEVADEEESELVYYDDEEESGHSKSWIIWLCLAIAACGLSFFAGYRLGMRQAETGPNGADSLQVLVKDSASMVDTVKTDTIKADTTEKKAAVPAAPVPPKAQPAAPTPKAAVQPAVPQQVKTPEKPQPKPVQPAATPAPAAPANATPPATAAPATPEVDYRQYERMDARIRTGAYRIVGTAREVTAQEGETIKRIANRILGPEMECYVEAYNGIKGDTPLTAGQTIKIPRLQWKKKKTTPETQN